MPTDAPIDPSPILQAGFAFWASKVLLTATTFGVFTRLSNGPKTGQQLAAEIGMHPRGIRDFFDTLVAMGVLDRTGEGPGGSGATYSNTPAAALYLDKNSPRYIGGAFEMLNARLFKYWDDLPEALLTGKPQNEVKHNNGTGIFDELYRDPAKLEQFMGAMTGLSRLNFEALAARFDFSQYKTLCDVGGALGVLSVEVAKKHPQIRCLNFDLPPVEPLAQKYIARGGAGLSDRVTTASGDFFKDPMPRADVITMGMILHDWNLEKKMHLIRAAYDALPEGGAFIVIEALIDDARRDNLFGLLMSLNMLIEFGDAFDYSAADFRAWCSEAGFKRFDVIPLVGPSSAAIAYK
jgi:hypothetical protein